MLPMRIVPMAHPCSILVEAVAYVKLTFDFKRARHIHPAWLEACLRRKLKQSVALIRQRQPHDTLRSADAACQHGSLGVVYTSKLI